MTNKQILIEQKETFNNSERYKINAAMDAARRDEAIAFGNLLKRFTTVLASGNEVLWQDRMVGGLFHSTEELYEIFKRQS